MGALVDSFRGPTLNTVLWNAVNSAGNSGQQGGGQYTFIVQAASTGDAGLASDISYNLTGSHLHVELLDAGVQEAGLEMYPIILTQNPANITNSLLIVVSNGFLGMYEYVAGVPTAIGTPAYNPVAHRWLRIRHAAGRAYFEASPDSHTWTTLGTKVPTIAITALYARVRAFCYLSLATAKTTAVTSINYLAPPDLPFPNGAIGTGMEIAFGADINGDQAAWPWVDVTPPGDSDFMSQTVTTARGRADESSTVAPTTAAPRLDNPAGDYTPDNPLGLYYPHVGLGTPARWWINASTPRLYLRPVANSRAIVASIATLNLTNDLDIRLDLHLKTTHPQGASVEAVGRNSATLFSWRVDVRADRGLTLLWSTDGVNITNVVDSDVPILPMSARATFRVTLDVNNGAGGHDVKFYVSDSVTGTFAQLGPTFTGAGVTSINNAAAPFLISATDELEPFASQLALDASVYRVQLRNGIGGAVILDANFTAQVSGLRAFVDSTGFAWTITAGAELSNRWFRIVGTADEWVPTWPWGDLSSQMPGGLTEGQARIDLTIAGVLRRLGQGASPLDSPLRRVVTDEPTTQAYWPMEDGKNSTQIASALPGGSPMTVGGEVTFASDSDLAGSKPLPVLTATSSLSGAVVGVFSGVWQVDWYMHIPVGPVSPTTIMRVTGTVGSTAASWVVTTSAAAVAVSALAADGTVLSTTNAPTPSFFGDWIHLRLQVSQVGINVEWFLTWVTVAYPAPGGFFFSNFFAGTVGGVAAVGIPPDALHVDMAIGHLAVFSSLVVASGNAATGWTGDTAAQRMIRLCGEQGVSLRIVGDPNTTALLGPQQVATLLTLLDDAAAADGGVLYEQLDAVGLIYRTRESMYNQPPNVVLDAHQQQIQNPFTPILDDQRTRNNIIVTRQGGSSVEVVDQDSIDRRGRYDESITLNLYQDGDVADAAGWLLHLGTVPGMRYPQLDTNLGVAPEVIDSWLTMDVSSRVDAINLPPQHPTATVRAVVEGYSEPISPQTWNPQMNCSPASVWDVGMVDAPWITADYLLRLETDGSVLATTVTISATTLFVTVTDGPYWVTAGGEFPFDIRVGGERLTVSAIGAPSGSASYTGGGNAITTGPTVNHVAPSVVAPAAGDLLICAWLSFTVTGTYTVPGAMTARTSTSGTYSTARDATQVLGASGATGTRTAVFSGADVYAAISLVAHGAAGTPVVSNYVAGEAAAAALTLTTTVPAAVGDWLVAIHGWDYDPGNNMVAPAADWIAVADSVVATATTSRVRVWAKRVTAAGVQSVTLAVVGGINDNHGRLYTLTGVTGVTQQFTVTRNVNGAARAHAVGSGVELWFQPVLAR